MSSFGVIGETLFAVIPGIPVTFKLTAISFVLGAILSVPLALLRSSKNLLLSLPARLYITVFRGTPLLLQLFLIYYGLARFEFIRHSLLWVAFREPTFCAILAFTLNMAAYASETVRGGLNSVDPGQVEAGRAAGMSRPLLYRRIILPQAFRQALPAYGSELIIMVKSTALASMVTVYEITGVATRVRAESYRFVEVLLAAALIYLAIAFLISRAVARLEIWLNPQASRRTVRDKVPNTI
ncbi:ABC transporter permease [Mesorhizobium cantuariense]|uniref:ABC transporter permease n=1 Tax=Mesorhizobium cantuariense TaxID=1300275 RepID=A0ABV7MHB4_9HYPH